MASLKVQLVAADRKVWEGEATMVSARSVDGELGVMADHQPLLTVLTDGDVTIKTDGGTHTAHVDSGFLSALRVRISQDDPTLGEALAGPGVQVALDQVIVRGDAALNPRTEVAFLPPMSGG